MFKAASYTIDLSKPQPVVLIDFHDGFTEQYSESDLVSAIETIRKQRMKYKSEPEFKAALVTCEGALEYLRQALLVEQLR